MTSVELKHPVMQLHDVKRRLPPYQLIAKCPQLHHPHQTKQKPGAPRSVVVYRNIASIFVGKNECKVLLLGQKNGNITICM